MSESIFETFTDERGNISVRVSRDVQVLTSEEADRIEAEYKRTQAENARLRELVDYMTPIALYSASDYERDRMRELGVEVTS